MIFELVAAQRHELYQLKDVRHLKKILGIQQNNKK